MICASGERVFEARFEGGDGLVGAWLTGPRLRHFEEVTARGTGAKTDEAGRVERVVGEQDARTRGEGSAEAVGLVVDDGDDAEEAVAQLDGVADFEF